jgi:pimeloyl-ACP methyl ester carboxylesterase
MTVAKQSLKRSERPRDVIEIRLQRIWETALKLSPIGRTDDFYELGGTSLQGVEVVLTIEEEFNTSLHPAILAENSTIQKLAAVLASDCIPDSGLLIKLQAGSGAPIFFVHSGMGDAAGYSLLARRLPGRTIYAFQAIGLHGEAWPLTDVRQMATRYLPEILAKDPDGPYLLGGACIGAMVSLELAQMLVARGKKVAMLALFDGRMPSPPGKHEKWARRFYVSIRTPTHEAWRIVRWGLGYALGFSRRRNWLPSWRKFVVHMHANAFRAYRPAPYAGEMNLFITTETFYGDHDPRLELHAWAQNARTISIKGSRAGLFRQPMVDQLTRELQAVLARAENAWKLFPLAFAASQSFA